MLLFLVLCSPVRAVEFRPQLRGLLPTQIEDFYRQLTKDELLAVHDALTFKHSDFYSQVKQLDSFDRLLSKRFFNAFSDLNKKLRLFSEPLRFFYFWRILHNVNEMLSFDVSESNLNKFASDVSTEWELLNVVDQKLFAMIFPGISARITSNEFQLFAHKGRMLWSVDRFVIPSE